MDSSVWGVLASFFDASNIERDFQAVLAFKAPVSCLNPERRTHWETIYQKKTPDSLSWYQPSLRLSMKLIHEAGTPKDAAIVDVGGGSSTLVDDLLSLGYSDITVLDISGAALEYSRARLGTRADSVKWITGDITTDDLPGSQFDLWHDRALFHFLVKGDERRRYCAALESCVRPGGYAIIATFGPNGPLKCSGLDIVRYSSHSLKETMGNSFRLISSQVELHTTPAKATQEFSYCLFQKVKIV